MLLRPRRLCDLTGLEPWTHCIPLAVYCLRGNTRHFLVRQLNFIKSFTPRGKFRVCCSGEIFSNRSAVFPILPCAPRYAIFLRNAVAEQTMSVKLVSPVRAGSKIKKHKIFLVHLQGLEPWTHCIPLAVYCLRGDGEPVFVRQINFFYKAIFRAANSEFAARGKFSLTVPLYFPSYRVLLATQYSFGMQLLARSHPKQRTKRLLIMLHLVRAGNKIKKHKIFLVHLQSTVSLF